MDNIFYSSDSTISLKSETITHKDTTEDKTIRSNKIILSVATFSLLTSGMVNVHTIKPKKNNIDMPNVEMESINFFSAETKSLSQDFTNSQANDDIMMMNNEKLEVEDLTERVTQAQLNEIKEHFDTKLNSLQQHLSTQIDQAKTTTIHEIKQSINDEHTELKNSKSSNIRFWVGSIIVPFGIVAATLFFTKIFHIY